MIQVAKRYYELDMTMGELAKELGLTRWQASRLLSDAREAGIVRIEIVPRASRSPDLESRLQRRFGAKKRSWCPRRATTMTKPFCSTASRRRRAGSSLASARCM